MARLQDIPALTFEQPSPGAIWGAALFLAALGTGAQAAAQEIPPAQSGVVIEADTWTRDEEKDIVTVEGNVEARYEGRVLKADKLIYEVQEGRVRALGSVELISGSGEVQFAEELVTDSELNVGVATGYASRLASGGTLTAGTAIRQADRSVELGRLVYTACPICTTGEHAPTWTLRARRAIQDKDRDLIVYRDAVLRFKNVPVLYLPYFAHPDPSVGRKDGLLPPSIGRNNRTGLFYTQPYLVTIDPYTDLTIAPQVFRNVNPLLNLDLRRRFYSGSVNFSGSITAERDFDNDGRRFGEREVRGHVFGVGSFRINDRWNWGFGVARSTDDLYIRRYDIQGAQTRRGIYGGDETRLFSQINLVGREENSYTEVSAISVQGLRFDDTAATTPGVLPVGETTHNFRDPLLGGTLQVQGSTAVLVRGAGETDSARLSAAVNYEVSRTLGPGVVVTPFAYGRSDAYRFSGGSSVDTDTLIRSVGLAGVEARWPFIRPGKALSLLVEPIAFVAVGSRSGNDPDIPNEDSLRFELDESSLFRPSGTPNFDRFEPGPRASFGLRATGTTQVGSVTAVAGRRWRADARPDLFDDATNLDERLSDWVAGVDADFRYLNANVRFRLDDNLQLQRIDAAASARLWRFGVTARYFNVREALFQGGPTQEISGVGNVRLTRRISTGYGVRRDLDRNTNLSQIAFLRYQDDCTFVELSYVRDSTFDRTLGPTTTVAVRIGLTSLGVVGTQ